MEGEREGSDGSDDLQGIKCRAPMEEVCDSADSVDISHMFLPRSHGVRSTIIMQLFCAGKRGVTPVEMRRRRE